MYEVVGWAVDELPEERPRHLLGIGDIDDLLRGVELGIDTFDCAMPTRLGRHGMALVPDPGERWRVNLTNARWARSHEPIMDGCPCPACAHGYSRAYLRYLLRQRAHRVTAPDPPQPRVHVQADDAAARGGGGRRACRDGGRHPRRRADLTVNTERRA